MKPNFKLVLILSFFSLLFVTSCQNEFLEETPQNQEETLVPDSPLTAVMRSTVTNDGTVDNILDESSCFTVNLPVTIIANGITITIDSLEDLEVIEEIYDEFEDDEDDLDFLFPITIILNDYDDIVIENEDALETFIDDCLENEVDDSIECVDFVYPITMSIYNLSFQVIDNVTFNNDEDLYDFLDEFEDETDDQVIIASLNFPVSLVYADGSTAAVNNNQELQTAINAAEEDCDDSDEDDNCTQDEIEMYLQECSWTINDYPETNDLENLYLNFGPNGTLQIIDGVTTVAIGGNWSMSASNDGLPEIIVSDLTAYEFLEGSWIIVECDDDEFLIEYETTAGEEIQFELEQECENDLDCSAQEMIQTLKECKWWMGTSLLSPNYSGPLFFNDDNVLQVGYPDNNQLEGTWQIALTDTGLYLVIELPGDYQVISLEWQVVECDDDRVEFVSGDYSLVIEQECNDDSNPLGCLEANEIVLCDENNDGYEVFNLYEGLSEIDECEINNAVSVSYHTSLVDAESNANELTGVSSYTNISSPQTIYVRIEVSNNPSEFEVLEIDLELEDCSEETFNITGEWEMFKREKQDIYIAEITPDLEFIYDMHWIDVTSAFATESTLEFNEDYSFSDFYADVLVAEGIWNVSDDEMFSFTFNDDSSNGWSDLQDTYTVNFYCDNTMSIQYLVPPPAGDNDFQDSDFYVIQYYRTPGTSECEDLIEYQVD